ncbi:MAG: hypothetical protein DRP27_08325 [Thermotogae bacterium]|nr:MAG: hypothetical protein DRP27_08325 [Thermotogota bacterium]
MKKLFVLLFACVVGAVFSIPSPLFAQTTEERVWTFSSSEDFQISDSSKIVFKNGSVKLKPVDFVSAGYKSWYDTHFTGGGSSKGYDIEVDEAGYVYVAGLTNDGAGGTDYAFVVKFNSNLEEIWYKRYLAGGGFQGIALAPDGNLIGIAEYIDSGDSHAYFKIYKINSQTGEVIWEKDPIARGNDWIDFWGDGAGPEVDRWGNIYYVHSAGISTTGKTYPAPHSVYKFDPNGNLLWKRDDDFEREPGETRPYHEDLWQAVVDSEGSIYFSTSVANIGGDLDYGLTKYDTNGNLKWRAVKHMLDAFDAPRGLSVDSNDYLYQNGNAGSGAPGAACGTLKYTKDGQLLKQIIESPISHFKYCWSSDTDPLDYKIIPRYSPASGFTLVKYDTELNFLGGFEAPITDTESKDYPSYVASDKFGTAYGVSVFQDPDRDNKYSLALVKGVNEYPDTRPDLGTPIYLINKDPILYDSIHQISVEYGPMDQSDVRFQLSNNGTDWYWWDGAKWTKASGFESNTLEEVNAHLAEFSEQVGGGAFYYRVFLITDGSFQVDLASIRVIYSPMGLPQTGGVDLIEKAWNFFVIKAQSFLKNLIQG